MGLVFYKVLLASIFINQVVSTQPLFFEIVESQQEVFGIYAGSISHESNEEDIAKIREKLHKRKAIIPILCMSVDAATYFAPKEDQLLQLINIEGLQNILETTLLFVPVPWINDPQYDSLLPQLCTLIENENFRFGIPRDVAITSNLPIIRNVPVFDHFSTVFYNNLWPILDDVVVVQLQLPLSFKYSRSPILSIETVGPGQPTIQSPTEDHFTITAARIGDRPAFLEALQVFQQMTIISKKAVFVIRHRNMLLSPQFRGQAPVAEPKHADIVNVQKETETLVISILIEKMNSQDPDEKDCFLVSGLLLAIKKLGFEVHVATSIDSTVDWPAGICDIEDPENMKAFLECYNSKHNLNRIGFVYWPMTTHRTIPHHPVDIPTQYRHPQN